MAEPTSQDLAAQISALQSAPAGTPTPAPETPGKPATTPAPAQPGQVPVEPPKEPGAPATDIKPSVQIVTPPEDKVTFEQLKAKTGIVDADALAASFQEAQRKITQQAEELKKLKSPAAPAPTPGTPATPATPPIDREAANARFVEELAKDPIRTIAKLVNVITESKIEPLAEDRKNTLLQKEVIRLATAPDTAATFNAPEVHDEMKKVCEENPIYLTDLPKNLSTVHDIAIGRLVRRGVVVGASKPIPGQVPVPEPGSQKPVAPQALDPKKASAAELEALINSLARK